MVMLMIYLIQNHFENTYVQVNFPVNLKWTKALDSSIISLSTANNNMVIARTISTLYGIDSKTGRNLWQHKFSWQLGAEPPVTKNGVVYATDKDTIWALNQMSGAVLWSQHISSTSWVTDASKDILTVQMGEYIKAYDAITGELKWSEPTCRGNAKAYIGNYDVFFPCSGIKAINITTGNLSWREKQDNWRGGYVDYSDNVIYYSPSPSNIVAFDLQTKLVLWNQPAKINGIVRLQVIGTSLFVYDGSRVCRFQKNSGSLLWCFNILSPQNPVLLGNVIYIFNGSQDEIYALDLSTGHEIGKLTINNFNYFIVYRLLMATTEDSLLFASQNEVFMFEK